MSRIVKTSKYKFNTIVNTPYSTIALLEGKNWTALDTLLDNITVDAVTLNDKIDAEITNRINEDASIRSEIDDTAASIRSEIAESQAVQDTRLDALEHDVSILQPEEIDDYKRRLNAVENKVATNATLLNTLSDNDKAQDNRLDANESHISDIDTEQGVQNERLTNLETGLDDYKTSNDEWQVKQDNAITALDDRVTAAETEITDIKSDMAGFDDELTAMTGQIATIANIGDGMQPKQLVTPVVIDGTTYLTVETALQGLVGTGGSGDSQPKTLVTPVVVDGVTYYTVETALQALSNRLISLFENGYLRIAGHSADS